MSSKKIIAREFLFLLSTALIGAFISLIIDQIHKVYSDRYNVKNEEVKSLVEKNNLPTRLKLYRFVHRKWNDDIYDLYYWVGAEDFITKIKGREGVDIYNDMKLNHDFNETTLDKFQKIVSEDSISEEYLAQLKLKFSERDEFRQSSRYWDGCYYWTWIILFLLLFALRYLIYATIWSIKTVRN